MNPDFWAGKRIVILGGAALIGSHFVEQLSYAPLGDLIVVDDLSSGKRENLPEKINFFCEDVRNFDVVLNRVKKADVVINLACKHGGRGYTGFTANDVELYDNLALDATVFRACAYGGVKKVFFSSSACAYPIDIQGNVQESLYLKEELVEHGNIKQADGAYGMEKLLAEHMLKAYVARGSFDAVICRFFTVYGTRMKENHAIAALIAKTLIKQEPFEIWGNGKQKRNWTYVKDTVAGAILAIEKGSNAEIFNIGSEEVNTPLSAASKIWEIMGWQPRELDMRPDKPSGPVNRIADASKAREVLGWYPRYSFDEGLRDTISWYVQTHDENDIRATLGTKLVQR